MELGRHIKRYRTEHGLSQEGLAEKIYVSRQTVSNWETDKTYPDVESLLLLSVLFDVTIDELIKGDVETMKQAVSEDVKKLNALGWVMIAFAVAAVIAAVGGISYWGWGIVPSTIIAVLLWGICMAAAVAADRIKKKHDLATYREILAFDKGEPIDRDNPKSRRARKRSMLRKVVLTVVAMAFGASLGVLCFKLFG